MFENFKYVGYFTIKFYKFSLLINIEFLTCQSYDDLWAEYINQYRHFLK